MVYASKLEADEAIAVASVIPIDRTAYMRADKVIGLEYLEHERQTWLWCVLYCSGSPYGDPTRYFGNVHTMVQTHLTGLWAPSINGTSPQVDHNTEITSPGRFAQRYGH